jgi:hypothetical protein
MNATPIWPSKDSNLIVAKSREHFLFKCERTQTHARKHMHIIEYKLNGLILHVVTPLS